jgi:hypothetical protein
MSRQGESLRRDGSVFVIVALALVGVALARLVGCVALEDVPHVMDEIAYSLQARTFASGHLTEAIRLPRGAFAMWFVDDRVRFFSVFPPGWPAVLAVGYVTGLASWVNPLLHGASTLLVSRAARLLAGKRAAAVAAAVYALSPQALLLAASFMSHTLVALMAAMVLVVGLEMIGECHQPQDGGGGAERDRPTMTASAGRWRLASGGVAIGVTALTRPLCGVVLFCVMAAFMFVALRRHRLRPIDVLVTAVPVVVLIGLLAAYNHHLTGSLLRFPQSAFFDEHAPPLDLPLFSYHPGCNDLGFGPGHGCETLMPGGMHTPANAVSNLGDNMLAWLWLAAGGPLAFVLSLVAFANKEARTALFPTLAAIPISFILYGLYWYAGTCYGARFYQVALPALLVLASVGLDLVARFHRSIFAVALGLILLWNGIFGFRAAEEVSHGYWGTDARFVHVADAWTDQPALVLVAFAPEELRAEHTLTTFMEEVVWLDNIRALAALAANRPDLSGPVVFARYHPGLMHDLRAQFPKRKRFLYIAHAKRSDDQLLPYDTSDLAASEATTPRPADNFDAYIVLPTAK